MGRGVRQGIRQINAVSGRRLMMRTGCTRRPAAPIFLCHFIRWCSSRRFYLKSSNLPYYKSTWIAEQAQELVVFPTKPSDWLEAVGWSTHELDRGGDQSS
jgi:hypothetical protein